ncbi:heme ABC transporter ATP-binding protein [Microbulbifer agarilyticus]|uniref:heme ABC transporter ATP-binding protein n=1 Tax=Microbulbifer agarilyticus TaxID=260552 RepID=UPI001C93E89F|nr:heme ABC transporter ATP-binding protein [Microbulbifer agarilyticus]MBY6210271.1 heme ABC transporter ATP-binding protein [Microbulbifer agarilyticus]
MLLEISDLSIHYPRAQSPLLEHISLNFHCGEVTALLGPNGSGKTSLLRAISGELQYSGHIQLLGRPQADWYRSQKALRALARRYGLLAQHSNLNFAFTCREVVQLGLGPGSLSRTEQETRIQHYMQCADVWHLRDRLFPSLSGGEKQRVQLARVLSQLSLADPGDEKILLLDEPTSALDLKHQHDVLALAREVADEKTAVIAVLHDLNLAARYADRMVMLAQGRIQADGTPADLLQPALIEQVYGYRGQLVDVAGYSALL